MLFLIEVFKQSVAMRIEIYVCVFCLIPCLRGAHFKKSCLILLKSYTGFSVLISFIYLSLAKLCFESACLNLNLLAFKCSISDQRIASISINSTGDWIAFGCSGMPLFISVVLR